MAKRKKTPPEVFERQQANIDYLRELLKKRMTEDERQRLERENRG